jgi:chitin disaccharide deacetylase
MNEIRLIVNADDYGRTPGVSRGIRKAHLEGIVTSTTALMNMPGVEDSLEQALRDCPRLGLGVHLVVTSGGPVLPAAGVSSLTGGGELFQTQQIARLEQIELSELRDEWHAQLEHFVKTTGRAPDHLDSHHHFSFFSEAIFRITLELANEFHCAVRSTLPARRPGETGGLPRPIYEKADHYVPALLEEYGVHHPDHFEATFYNETGTVEHLSDILIGLLEGSNELMCHPGYVDEALLGERGSGYNKPRENELATLTDPRILNLMEQRGIKRITFAEL